MANISTPDLCDEFADVISVAEPLFRTYGKRNSFGGQIVTIKCFEDNTLVREALSEAGAGRVLVVDGGGSMRRALLGDNLAANAVANGWEGIIINGCLRDVDEINGMTVGVKALGTHPMKTEKRGEGERDVPVEFAGIRLVPGQFVYADNNGIITTPSQLL